MNFRLTAVLFGLVFALAAGLFALALFATDPDRDRKGPFAALLAAGVTDKDVDRLELTRTIPRPETLVFRKLNGKWRLTSPADAPTDSAALDLLVRGLLDARPADYAGTLDPALVGLGEPALKITLARGDTAATAHVGNTSMGKESAVTFFAPSDDPKRVIPVPTAAVRGTLFRKNAADGDGDTSLLVKWRSDFRTTQLLSFDTRSPDAEVVRVAVTAGGKTTELERAGTDWKFGGTWAKYGLADAAGANTPEEAITGVRPLLNAVLLLQTTGPADVTEPEPGTAPDWAKYGLADGDPEAVQVDLTPAGKPAVWVRIGKPVLDEKGQPVLPPRRFCRVKDDNAVFKVATGDKERLAAVAKDPAALRNRDLLPLAKLDRYDALDGTAGGGFQLRRTSGGPAAKWAVYGGGPPPAEGNPQAVRGLLAALTTPRLAVDILPAPDDTAFDTTAVSLTLWADAVPAGTAFDKDGKPPAPPAPKGDPVKLTFGKKVTRKVGADERLVVIVRREQGGEKTDFAVTPEVAAVALRNRLAFVNTLLPSFVPESATGLVLSPGPGGQRAEFVKDPKATDPAYPRGVWKAGTATADGDAVLELLRLLANPAAVPAVETDNPPKEYGLDPAAPVLRAKVTLPADKADGKPREVEYLFGNPPAADPKEGPKSVYFRAVGGGVVYTVPADKLDKVRSADLTDKVVLRVDAGKAKMLVFNGWAKEVNGKRETTSATLKLTDGVWVATDAGGKQADQLRARDWVGALRAVKQTAKAELVGGKEPEAWGFGVAPVSVIAGDEKGKSLGMLTLGAPDGKGGIYVRLDGEQKYYLVDATPFIPLLAAPPLK